MPKVTIWIKEEDLDKWIAVKDRPAFIHNALNGVGGSVLDDMTGSGEDLVKAVERLDKPIKTPKEADNNAWVAVDKFMGELPKVIKSPRKENND